MMQPLEEQSIPHAAPQHSPAANSAIAWLIGPVFLVLAGWFMLDVDLAPLPEMTVSTVPAALVSTQPLRQIMRGEPTINSGGFDLRCSECHRLFPSRPDAGSTMAQHTNIALDHGVNNRCLNCHDRFDRNRLRLHDGSTVAFEDAPLLCSNCHGPTFRDWERGMHGRTNGYWNTEMGEQRRLLCTECHDPHAPDIAPMTALPGPNTLRMRTHDEHAPAHGPDERAKRDPLRQWNGTGAAESSLPKAPPEVR